ncbi:hypothetical protein [Pseudoxanthomonas composti]|uniref:hypothetical protein n=1 Tax=Pseudoxanthomonas composti TaxID=2137479 RepID=UPI0013E93B0D|nr:hypothetical protein [Pseudoxanthomonas composti]
MSQAECRRRALALFHGAVDLPAGQHDDDPGQASVAHARGRGNVAALVLPVRTGF